MAMLGKAFIDAPSFDETLPQMLNVLRGYSSKDIDEIAVRAIETVLNHQAAPWWALETITELEIRLTGAHPREQTASNELAEEFNAVTKITGPSEGREIDVQMRWDNFKKCAESTRSRLRNMSVVRSDPVGGNSPL
jgi:hypothetical protein